MLKIEKIVKNYADHRALDDVSFEVEKGKIHGLLGPNGAGKTSLIRIINQITAPDSGQILFNGEVLQPKHIHKIGYLPEERGLYKKMKIGEQLIYLGQLKGLSKTESKDKIRHWFGRLKIDSWLDKKVEDLSKGMQQKVQFVATVLHEPDLIILDEPFSGFDPVNAQTIQDEILTLNDRGATIIYSTHRMESVEELCDNITLINKSKIVLNGNVQQIKNSYKNRTYRLKLSFIDQTLINNQIDEYANIIDYDENINQKWIQIEIKDDYRLNDVLRSLIDLVDILEVIELAPTMQDIFIEKVTPKDIYTQENE